MRNICLLYILLVLLLGGCSSSVIPEPVVDGSSVLAQSEEKTLKVRIPNGWRSKESSNEVVATTLPLDSSTSKRYAFISVRLLHSEFDSSKIKMTLEKMSINGSDWYFNLREDRGTRILFAFLPVDERMIQVEVSAPANHDVASYWKVLASIAVAGE
jgi:hypothetical protein